MRPSLFRALSGLCVNLAAAWLGLIFIAPGFVSLDQAELTKALGFSIFNLVLAIVFDKCSL